MAQAPVKADEGNPATMGNFTGGHQAQEVAHDINDIRKVRQEAKLLNDMVELHNKKYPDFQVSNHLKNLKEGASQPEVHAALAKTFASYLVRYYESHGISRDQLKNIQVKMSDGTMHTVSLIKPDGTVENDPEKLIGTRRPNGRFDFDGGNPNGYSSKDAKILDKTDGILTTLTWANPNVTDTRDACFGQLSRELPRYLIAFKPPAVATPSVGQPQQPVETPYTARIRPIDPPRGATPGSRVNVNTNDAGPTEAAVVTPIQIQNAPVGGAFVVGGAGGGSSICLPNCPPVVPRIAN